MTEPVVPTESDEDRGHGAVGPATGKCTGRGAGRVGDPGTGPVLSRTPTSGAKRFAAILGLMLGIIGVLWLIATLVSPH